MSREGVFLSALSAEAARRVGPVPGLRADLEEIHRSFTSARGGREPDYFRSARLRSAYLASLAVPNAARALHVMRKSGLGLGSGERALDAGAGTGAAALALASLSHRDAEIVLADQSAPALELAASLFSTLFPDGPRVTTVEADVTHELPTGKFQIVLAGHLLNEHLPRRGRDPGDALLLARSLAERAGPRGSLVLLEPAQRIPARALAAIRGRLIETGLAPIFPCTHAEVCPVLARRAQDWCVTDVPFARTPLIEEVDTLLGTDRRRLTVAALVLTRNPAQAPAFAVEVLSEPMRAGKDTLLYLCAPAGRLVVRMPRPPAKPLPRGSRLLFPAKARPDGRDRSGAPLFRLRAEDLVRIP